ncbi:MAG: hypothetical protein H3C51_00090 [Rubellimicrobium sp.]|nr:hypothetical protein [Rubellimicrobium sp.]
MPRGRASGLKGAGAALALAFTAAPALAQVTAADVWHGWGAALARVGVTQTGTTARAGDVMTVTDAGAVIEMPFGRIGWHVGQLALHDDGDGSVRVTLPRGVPVMLDLDLDLRWHHPRLSLGGELTAEGLDWRYSGTPDDLQGHVAARRLTFELTAPEGAAAGGGATTGFVVAEDVDRTTRIRLDDVPRLEMQATVGHLTSEISVRRPQATTVQRAEYRGIETAVALRLPETAPAAPSLSAALRAGMRLHASGRAGELHVRDIDRRGHDTLRDVAQTVQGARWALDMTRGRGLELALDNRAGELAFDGAPVARVAASTLRLRLPLIARSTPQETALVLTVAGIEALGPWAVAAGDGAAPAHLDLALRGEIILRADLADGRGAAGRPYDLLRLELQRLDAALGGAALTGSGAFAWRDGSGAGRHMAMPEGEATLVAQGVHALLARVAATGRVPDLVILSLRGMLAMVGTPTGPDRVEAHLTIDDAGIRINGLALPF